MTLTEYSEMTSEQKKIYAAQQANAAYTNGDIPMFFFWTAVEIQPVPCRHGYITSFTFRKTSERKIYKKNFIGNIIPGKNHE